MSTQIHLTKAFHTFRGYQLEKSPCKFVLSGVWRQYDEGLLSWTPWWGHEQPLGGRDYNCGAVGLAEDVNAGKWATSPCSATLMHYICEKGRF